MKQMNLFGWNIFNASFTIHSKNENVTIYPSPKIHEIFDIITNFINANELISKLKTVEEIWIKPNLTGIESPEQGKTSQPLILDSLIQAIKSFISNKQKIYIGDSSVIGCNTLEAAKVSGILDICIKNSVDFIDLRNVDYVTINVPSPIFYNELSINKPFVSRNSFKINLAKIKTTYGSPIGFCIKNNKGIISDELKLKFHLKGLQKSLYDLGHSIKWDLSILEGLPISELGIPGYTGPIGLSTNSFLLDYIMCKCMKVPIEKVHHLVLLSNYYDFNDKNLTSHDDLRKFYDNFFEMKFSKSGIKQLQSLYKIQITDCNPCTGCVESFAKAFERISKNTTFNIKNPFLLGAGIEKKLNMRKRYNLIGNCAFDRIGMELCLNDFDNNILKLWSRSIKIEGCPPTIDKLVNTVVSANKIILIDKSKRIQKSFDLNQIQLALDSSQYHKVLPAIPIDKINFLEFGHELSLACEVICAAICHQINWDFLRHSIYYEMKNNSDWCNPNNLSSVNKNVINNILKEYPKKERIRAEERSKLIRSLQAIFYDGINDYTDIFKLNKNNDVSIIISRLKKSIAFSEDTENKKIQVLFHSLARLNIIPWMKDFCEPAIDYHIMRVYLRRGDVQSTSSIGKEFESSDIIRRSSTVNALRAVVSEALSYAASMSNVPIYKVNDIEWWIGRSICTLDKPDCGLIQKKSSWLKKFSSICPFVETCFAYNYDKSLLKINEPRYIGSLY